FGASPTKTPGTMEPAAGGLFFRGPKCGSWARWPHRERGRRPDLGDVGRCCRCAQARTRAASPARREGTPGRRDHVGGPAWHHHRRDATTLVPLVARSAASPETDAAEGRCPQQASAGPSAAGRCRMVAGPRRTVLRLGGVGGASSGAIVAPPSAARGWRACPARGVVSLCTVCPPPGVRGVSY